MKNYFVLLLFVIVLFSCNSNNSYKNSLKVQKGMKYDSVVSIMGIPNGIYIDSIYSEEKKVIYYSQSVLQAEVIEIYFDSNNIVIGVSNDKH